MAENNNTSKKEIEQTPVFGIAIAICFVGYIILMINLPLPGDPGFWPRVGIGVASGYAGLIIYSGALNLVEFAIKAIVEVLAVLLMLANVTVGALVWTYFGNTEEPFTEEFIGVVIVVGLLLFIVDILALIVLVPLARTVGTSLE